MRSTHLLLTALVDDMRRHLDPAWTVGLSEGRLKPHRPYTMGGIGRLVITRLHLHSSISKGPFYPGNNRIALYVRGPKSDIGSLGPRFPGGG